MRYLEHHHGDRKLRKVRFQMTSLGCEKLVSELRISHTGFEQTIRETLTDNDRKVVHAAIPVQSKISQSTARVG